MNEDGVPIAHAGAGWLAPEPWSRTLWGVTKQFVLFGGIFWAGMRLMGLPVGAVQATITALFFSSTMLMTRRGGSMMPAAPTLILGAVTLIMAAVVGAVALWTSDHEPLGFCAMGAFLGGVLLWFGSRARKHEQELADGLVAERVSPLPVPRRELATRVAAYREEQGPRGRSAAKWIVGGAGGLVLLIASGSITGINADLPDWIWAVAFFGGWGAAGLGLRHFMRRERLDAARHGLVCAACDRSYFSVFGNMRLLKVIEEAGLCPQCGVRIVTKELP